MPPPGPPYQPPPPAYPQPYPMVPAGPPEAPGATAAMVCGIISLALVPIGCCTYGISELASLPLGIVAVVLGFRARGRIARAQGTLIGSGKATAGIVTGLIAIGLAVIVGILVVIVGLSFAALQNAFPSPSP